MYYVQFYQKSAISDETIEACGDRSVVILDGRESPRRIGEFSESECAKRGYIAWRVFKGETFTRGHPVSQLNFIHSGRPDNSAMSATWGA